MDAKSEVILRQDHDWLGTTLLVNPPQDILATHFQQSLIWTWNYADHHYFTHQNFTSYFDIVPPQQAFQQIIIFIPKARQQLQYVLDQCAALLQQGQQIFLVGEKKAGIEGAAKQLADYGKYLKLDSARHCQLWQLTLCKEHHAKPLQHWISTYSLDIFQQRITICALPGVFSQQHLDIGTAELLPYLSQVKSGEILDFGCGAGIISILLAIQNTNNSMTAVDIDAFALESTARTFAENDRSTQLKTIAITDIQDIPENFDAIVSNPPFHQGIKTHYQASENLCQFAFDRLKSKGELWIVANRFLNYAPFIEHRFGHCQIKTDQNGFKVLYAKK
ncbi:class I SAM-dependent methyltransferase [Acinetobacter qingfengensis]|uniref:Ribosomal RNA small subunit methyltransferase C n=1 Tax=Acinetobacter qingfengensis TaxID=1262585 RepID=A0A1E7RFR6_9GAMM|nr:class I SAM-dependent methyltransferase [Acinetobacter qingfengensis]KAA8732775.1 class I SAM-dependent methyltransferase [Acinetobacter qingfengensis]OEY98112.1 16S rRNA methyltransferase [Acinetobacter qingfengensis]